MSAPVARRLRSISRALADDLTLALRLMRRAPRFFLAVSLIASLGVGATSAMASLVEALLRPPPFPDLERLVWLSSTRADGEPLDVSLPDVLDWQRRAQSFEHLAYVTDWAFAWSVPGFPPSMEIGALVSGDYFPALGVKPLLGRLLQAQDDAAGEPCRVVLSAATFRTRLGADPAWLGQSIELDGKPCTLVGVTAEGFDFCWPRYGRIPMWVTARPMWRNFDARAREASDEHLFHVIGRLRGGVTPDQVRAELVALAASNAAAHPGQAVGTRLTSLYDELVLDLRPRVWGLFAAITCLFLATCTNTASLFLVRSQVRRSELAMRSALGATPGRLLRQLMLEMALVFALALPGAWLAAQALVAPFKRVAMTSSLPAADIAVNERLLLGCLLLSSATGVLFGLGPALALSRAPLGPALVEAGSSSLGSPRQRRLRNALVAAQVAAASALLVSSGTAVRAVAALLRTPGGLDDKGVVSVFMSPPRNVFPDDSLPELQERLLAGVRSRPGVVSATIGSSMPLFGQTFDTSIERVAKDPRAPRDLQPVVATIVRPGFFETLRIPLLEGRDFDAKDGLYGQRVAIINETLRARYFPHENPIGQMVRSDFGLRIEPFSAENVGPTQIIGVAGDIRRFGLQREAGNQVYFPFSQYLPRTADLIVRLDPTSTVAPPGQVSRWVRELEPRLPIWRERSSTGVLERSVGDERLLSRLLSGFAAASLALVALGVYAVSSYATARRTREFGLRAALGASPWNIVWHVTREALSWIVAGLVLGLAGARALGGALARQIAGAPAFDPEAFIMAAFVVALVALLACAVPAFRAVRLTPASALRSE